MNKNLSEAVSELRANVQTGLDEKEAQKRLKQYGLNKLVEKKPTPFWKIFIEQFLNPMIILLLIATIIALLIAFVPSLSINENKTAFEKTVEKIEPFIILLIVLLNSLFGAIQEAKSAKALDSLNKLIITKNKVYRNDELIEINSDHIVKGDLVYLEAGDAISFDGIIVECDLFKTNEASLTGETTAVLKDPDFISEKNTNIADKKNFVFSGTNVLNGKASVLVTHTGMETEIGKIANLLGDLNQQESQLEKKVKKLSKYLGIMGFGLLIAAFLLLIFYVNDVANIATSWSDALKLGLSFAIAIIPEGLFAIMTITFAIGIKRMVKQNALIKKLQIAETLGNISFICTDKTGTITQNKLSVIHTYYESLNNNLVDTYACLCNDALFDKKDNLVGDSIDIALINHAFDNEKQYEQAISKYTKIATFPFDSERKLMSVICEDEKGHFVIVKGAYDVLKRLSNTNLDEFEIKHDIYAKTGLKVLAIAYKRLHTKKDEYQITDIENDLHLIGLYGIKDPLRPEAKEAFEIINTAKINPVMITGDHISTAIAIANELNLLTKNKKAITGSELDALTDSELKEQIRDIAVYARVNPLQKLRIVSALKQLDEIVLMTGDGVNDAAALKKADVGCAMGKTGTEVSKEAASLVLLDDNFKTIVEAIKQGRGIVKNLKKIFLLVFTINLINFLTVFLGILIFKINPFNTIQILWINLITESLPAIALAMNNPSNELMHTGFKINKSLIDKKMLVKIILNAAICSVFSLLIFYLVAAKFVDYDFIELRTVFAGFNSPEFLAKRQIILDMQSSASAAAFIVITISSAFNGFNLLSNKSIFTYKWNDSKNMFYAFLISVFLVLFVILVPYVNEIFNSNIYLFFEQETVKVNGTRFETNNSYLFFLAFVFALIPTGVIEISKAIYNSNKFKLWTKKHPKVLAWNAL